MPGDYRAWPRKLEAEAILNSKTHSKERKSILFKTLYKSWRCPLFHHRPSLHQKLLGTTCLQHTHQIWPFLTMVLESNFSKLSQSCPIPVKKEKKKVGWKDSMEANFWRWFIILNNYWGWTRKTLSQESQGIKQWLGPHLQEFTICQASPESNDPPVISRSLSSWITQPLINTNPLFLKSKTKNKSKQTLYSIKQLFLSPIPWEPPF